jgi:hypothetical protein
MQLGPGDAITGKQSIERRIAKEIIERWLAPWLLHGVPLGYERRLTLSSPGVMTYGGQDLGHFVISGHGPQQMGNCLSLFVSCLLLPSLSR